MAARFRVKEPTRIGSREAHLTVRCLPRVLAFQPLPVARPPSPAFESNYPFHVFARLLG